MRCFNASGRSDRTGAILAPTTSRATRLGLANTTTSLTLSSCSNTFSTAVGWTSRHPRGGPAHRAKRASPHGGNHGPSLVAPHQRRSLPPAAQALDQPVALIMHQRLAPIGHENCGHDRSRRGTGRTINILIARHARKFARVSPGPRGPQASAPISGRTIAPGDRTSAPCRRQPSPTRR